MQDVAVHISGLTKKYIIFNGEKDRFLNSILKKNSGHCVEALRDIELTICKGQVVGFVGLNGSGKSTLSRIIAGITHPTSGLIETNGTVNLLSAGVGLNSNLSGRENIYYKCLLLGFPLKKIREMEQRIIDFAELGIFIDQPLRMYSSGMRARLGFAISIHLDPDILIVDEALSVGDASFSEKCMERMREMCREDKTVIFVSHSAAQVESMCSHILWLHNGKVVSFGQTAEVMGRYKKFTSQWRKMSPKEREMFNN